MDDLLTSGQHESPHEGAPWAASARPRRSLWPRLTTRGWQTAVLLGLVVVLQTLQHLHLRGTKTIGGNVSTVSDAALAELSKHPESEELDLRETAITDAGLPALKEIAGLKRLDLRCTAVSQRAVKQLAESLPNCEILRPQ